MSATHSERQQYYEEFSLAVGLRDWLKPNLRHYHLKRFIKELLAGRRGLRILDIGCSTGVMTSHLTRFGDVTGTDFSTAAIKAAQRIAPKASFLAGTLDDLPAELRYDLITLFDVLEHIPEEARAAFLMSLAERLEPEGLIFASTPFPTYTRYKREQGDAALQIIDEEVELPAVMAEAANAGLQVIEFHAYDVFAGSPEYQAIVLTHTGRPGGPVKLVSRGLRRRGRMLPIISPFRRLRNAAGALARGDRGLARWFLTAKPPTVRS